MKNEMTGCWPVVYFRYRVQNAPIFSEGMIQMVIQLSMERTWNDHQLLIIVSFQPDERGFGEIAGIRLFAIA